MARVTMHNRLAQEKSPYLRQHADNPVDWYPWGEAAFAKARAEQKPIFLSIGYSTCHWCHVMAHESFENAEVAEVLNQHFVSVKVDREERPDVDRVYMTYVQAMTGHGGWPLSAWLTPELKPFYGGTYFPPADRQGRAGLVTVLQAIARGWRDEREKLVAEGDRVIEALRAHQAETQQPPAAGGSIDQRIAEAATGAFEKCFQSLYEGFDAANGGFGGAPKFPRAANLNFLFRVAAIQGLESDIGREAVKMAAATLQRMAEGGLHDHVGGGFHRYSVDETWFVPHFEKMVYDQAQIARNYVDARLATGREIFAWLARDILDYALRDLAAPDGGFYSAEDADSLPGGGAARPLEGAYYVWSKTDFDRVLGADAAFCAAHFGVVEEGNVPAHLDPQGELKGRNVLKQRQSLLATAKAFGQEPEAASERLLSCLEKLRQGRRARPRPLRDEKIVTAWNGLMISALSRAARLIREDSRYLAAAQRAARFVRDRLFDAADGRLWRSFLEGRGPAPAFAEDYAFLIEGLLDLYETDLDIGWLRWADGLQAAMDARFWDQDKGGYFTAEEGGTSLVLRLKEDHDGAEPAASSVAAANLFRLSTLLADGGEARRERGLRTLEAFRGQWTRTPQALPEMLCAIELALEAPRQVVLVGSCRDPEFQQMHAVLHERLAPRRAVLALTGTEEDAWLLSRSPALAGMKAADGKPAAYVCEHYTCQRPVTTAEELRRTLG